MSEEQVKDVAPNEPEEAPKGKKKKKRTVIAVVVVVIVVAIAGGLVWHEQPSFCNAICHTSMDPYLGTYEAVPGQSGMDKWGNTVADCSGMLAATHREAGVNCLGCHTPTMSEQLEEGREWLTGDYTLVDNPTYGMVPAEKDLKDLTAARGAEDETEFCLNESCHNVTKKDLQIATANYKRNPHSFYHSEYTCTDCHKSHRASIMVCTKCHTDSTVPDGWLTWGQTKALEDAAA